VGSQEAAAVVRTVVLYTSDFEIGSSLHRGDVRSIVLYTEPETVEIGAMWEQDTEMLVWLMRKRGVATDLQPSWHGRDRGTYRPANPQGCCN
jgi:hypothetical protein